MDTTMLSNDDEIGNNSSTGNDYLPEGIGSDASMPSVSSDYNLFDGSVSTPEDLQDDEDYDDVLSSDIDSDGKDDDDGNDGDNDEDDGDNDADVAEDAPGDDTPKSSTPSSVGAGPDANLTMSFLSVPDGMKPAESQPKGKRKYTPKDKSKSPAGPRKKRRRKGKDGDGDGSGNEAEGSGEKKGKRKNKPAHRRRNIQKFLTHGELTADTLTAQQEEEERRKRLEEQKNAAALNGAFEIPRELIEIIGPQSALDDAQAMPTSSGTIDVSTDVTTPTASAPAPGPLIETIEEEEDEEECIILGSSSESEDERAKKKAREAVAQKKDVIEISSDDDAVTILSDDDDDDDEAREGMEESGLHTNDALNQPDIFGRVLVNVIKPQSEEDIFLPSQIARAVKPHQIGGIRFLYDNLVESLSRFKITSGFGCILAHSMGLGKTLQMISFIDIFLRHTEAKTVLCIVPINTIQNWLAEFDMWLPESRSNGVKTVDEPTSSKQRKNAGSKRSKANQNSNSNSSEATKLPDSMERPVSTPVLEEGDSRGPTPTPSLTNDDTLSSDGQASSSASKSSIPVNGEEFPEDVMYRQFPIFVMNDNSRTMAARHQIITDWYKTGGVLLMGYEMYRMLSIKGAMSMSSSLAKHINSKKKKKKKTSAGDSKPVIIDIEEEDRNHQMAQELHKALCRPGPDLVVCDEGHRIKNIHAGISQALKNIRTRRRVVLTGYPLQNNLQEYWCMVDFVRPNFLGTRHEFANLFERPIQNGQCIDSTYKDVQLMRFRAHVLYSLLEGFVQRRGFSVLHTTLPPKEESVLMVRLTPFQRGLYVKFMQSFTEMGAGGWCSANPLKAFSVGCKIWNHPDILCDVLQMRDEMTDVDTDLDLPEPSARCSKRGRKPGSKSSKKTEEKAAACDAKKEEPDAAPGATTEQSYQEKVNQIISFEWARDIMKNYQANKLCNGGKMMLLFEILENSIQLGDRLLVFSQSLSTLSLIEKFLAERAMPKPPDPPADFAGKWVRNKTYFRLDGSTPASDREKMINQFNHEDNKAVWLFLLSTRAGCLGINLIGANRVIVLDASWNPCHDAQAVCRVYRYGQKKKCHIYRMVTDNTLEKKIYDRQISKKGMSDRVVDEMNPEINLTKKEVETLLEFDADADDTPYEDFSNESSKYSDPMLANICNDFSNFLSKAPFSTESLIWDRKDSRLTRAEKRLAKKSYEEEKRLRVSYSRPSYTAYYPKDGGLAPVGNPTSRGGSVMQPNFGMPSRGHPQFFTRPLPGVHPMQSTPVPRYPPSFAQSNPHQRLAELQQAGVSMQKIVATTDIVLPGVNTMSSGPVIKAGQTVTFIKTQKGLYLRTTDGRILAVRGPSMGPSSKSSSAGPQFGQFTSLASDTSRAAIDSMVPQQWSSASGTGVTPVVTGGRSGINDSHSSSQVVGSSVPSTDKDTVDKNQMNLQQLLDKHDMAVSLANSSGSTSVMPQQMQFTSSGGAANPTQHLGYPQSLQSLNSLVLREGSPSMPNVPQEATPSASQRTTACFGAVSFPSNLSGKPGTMAIPTTASILSSSGHLASVTPANHRLLPQQPTLVNSPLASGTVPLAAIGMLAPPVSTSLSVPPSVTSTAAPSAPPSLPVSSSKLDVRIPLTLNSLLDGDHMRAASKSQTPNTDDKVLEQSAIAVNLVESIEDD